MTPLGKYEPKTVDGKMQIEAISFISSNWANFCEIVELFPIPELTVLWGAEQDLISSSDTAAMFVDYSTGNVFLNKTDLDTDMYSMSFSRKNPIGLLWGMPAAMIRAMLLHRGNIDPQQKLGMIVARKAGWPKRLIKILQDSLGQDNGSEEFKIRCDTLLIQGAIQNYIQSLSLNAQVDLQTIVDIIWSRRDTLNIELFKFSG